MGTKTGKGGGVDTLRLHLEPFLQRKWKSFQHHGIKMLYGKGLTNITIFEHYRIKIQKQMYMAILLNKKKITRYTDIKLFLPKCLKYTAFREMRILDMKK